MDGWQKTSATSTKGGVPVTELWFLSNPSVGRAGARTQSVHHRTNADGHASMPLRYLSGSMRSSPPTAPSSASSAFGEAVSMASVFLVISCWGGTRMTDHTLGGDGSLN